MEDQYVNINMSQLEDMCTLNCMCDGKLSKYVESVITVPGNITPKYCEPTIHKMLRTTYVEYLDYITSDEILEIIRSYPDGQEADNSVNLPELE